MSSYEKEKELERTREFFEFIEMREREEAKENFYNSCFQYADFLINGDDTEIALLAERFVKMANLWFFMENLEFVKQHPDPNEFERFIHLCNDDEGGKVFIKFGIDSVEKLKSEYLTLKNKILSAKIELFGNSERLERVEIVC